MLFLRKTTPLKEVWELPTPKNISYLWGFGRLLSAIIAFQIFRGLLLTFFYVRGQEA
jgi:quinol-cytochrome oxidoreductase complex cytochrome b subunit